MQPLVSFYKVGILKKFRKIHTKTPVPKSLYNKVPGLQFATLLRLKRNSVTDVICECWEILQNSSIEHFQVTAFKMSKDALEKCSLDYVNNINVFD